MAVSGNFLIIFLSFAIWLAIVDCKIGVHTLYNYSTAVFQCIAKNGYSNASISIISGSQGIDQSQVSANIYSIKNAGLGQSIWYSPCRSNDADQQFQDFVLKIKRQFYDKIWLYFYSSAWEMCSWEAYGASSNCKYLTQIIQLFKSIKIPVGIVTGPQTWQKLFKDKCNKAGAQQLFWIPKIADGNPDFNDFQPFGGWSQPKAKLYQYGKEIPACGANVFLYYF